MLPQYTIPHCPSIKPARGGKTPVPLRERFGQFVAISEGCWLWTGAVDRKGYGVVYDGKQRQLAHRAAWALQFGYVPAGFLVCHHCDNPPCIRLSHLFLGTVKDNSADMVAKGRWGVSRSKQGEQNHRAKLTNDQAFQVAQVLALGSQTHAEIAEKYKVSPATISHIAMGIAWSSVTGVPKATRR